LSRSLYEAVAPVLVRSLGRLVALIDKAAACGVAEADILDARLAPDMLPFTKQVQIASDTAKFAMARLTATEGPVMPDTETTLAQLRARIERTIAYVESVDPAGFEGAEDRPIVLKFPSVEMRFAGRDYVSQFVLPNLFFHITVAYALLRAKGVKIGKNDFLPIDIANVSFTG
jgi:uncharacterized protein